MTEELATGKAEGIRKAEGKRDKGKGREKGKGPSACLLALVACISIGCSRQAAQEYELTGQVLAVDESRQEVTIRHEDIPRFMPAMTMAFKVREPGLLAGRVPGDLVSATLVVSGNEVHLRRLERTGFAPVPDTAGVPPRPLDPGDPVADAALVDRTGAARELAEWRGRALAVTFTYTRCPLPDFCPLMDRRFRSVQEQIRTDSTLVDAARLLTVSIDPQHDTPAVIAAHAAAVKADPAIWEFLTGESEALRTFAGQFGVSVLEGNGQDAGIVHNLRTAVIDPDGRLTTVFAGSDWDPADLAAALREARARR